MNAAGNFFEDFCIGEEIVHATPRTITEGDVTLYLAIYGSRFPLTSSDPFAQALGFSRAPVDDLLVFHIVFGKSVPDISLNAVANLGYAGGVFGRPVLPGDTISARSKIIGLRESSSGSAGVVYVRTEGANQRGEEVLRFIRWVLVRKRGSEPASAGAVPQLPETVSAAEWQIPPDAGWRNYDPSAAGSDLLWEDFPAGTRIDHVDGTTIEEAEHQLATRLFQNPARVHFDQHLAAQGRFGRRLVYGGHIISLARALTFNGLGNAFKLAAIHGGQHANPVFAGDTIYAWTEVIQQTDLPGHARVGGLRLRTTAAKNRGCADFPGRRADGKFPDDVVLEFDHSVLMPRRAGFPG
jgi:2-methylfumaryl-CoA hydratase